MYLHFIKGFDIIFQIFLCRQEIVNGWQHPSEFVIWELSDKMTQDSILSAVFFTISNDDIYKDIDGLLIK